MSTSLANKAIQTVPYHISSLSSTPSRILMMFCPPRSILSRKSTIRPQARLLGQWVCSLLFSYPRFAPASAATSLLDECYGRLAARMRRRGRERLALSIPYTGIRSMRQLHVQCCAPLWGQSTWDQRQPSVLSSTRLSHSRAFHTSRPFFPILSVVDASGRPDLSLGDLTCMAVPVLST